MAKLSNMSLMDFFKKLTRPSFSRYEELVCHINILFFCHVDTFATEIRRTIYVSNYLLLNTKINEFIHYFGQICFMKPKVLIVFFKR